MNKRTKQAFYSTIISYTGVFVGFITSAILLPRFLFVEQVGLVKLITATIGLFAGVFSLGVHQFFFRAFHANSVDPSKQNNLFYVSLRAALFGVFIAMPFYFLFHTELLNIDQVTKGFSKSSLFVLAVFLAIAFRILYNAIISFIRMKGKIIVDSFIQNIVLKVGLLFLIVLFIIGLVSYSSFVYLYIFIYLLFPILAIIYMIKMNYLPKLERVKYDRSEKKEFYRLLFYGTLASLGSSIYLYLDTFMVNFFLTEYDVGVYGTMFLFGIIVSIPSKHLRNASVSKISEFVANNNLNELGALYKRLGTNMLLIGGGLFLGVLVNMDFIYSILPDDYGNTYYVVLFIGIAQLVDMVTSVNFEIIASSKLYRYNTYIILFSILIAVIFNVVFIPLYGIEGAALGTLMAVLCINIIRMIIISKRFDIYPVSSGTIKGLSAIFITYFILYFFPVFEIQILDLVLRSVSVVIIYTLLIYLMNISDDFNTLVNKYIRKR